MASAKVTASAADELDVRFILDLLLRHQNMTGIERSCGVSNMLGLEEILHDMGLLLPFMQVRANRALQLPPVSRSALGQPQLQIVIEQFIGVQLGRITRQKVQRYSAGLIRDPAPHRRRFMHRMSIHNQHDLLAFAVFHDALQKVNEGRRHKAPFKHLKGQRASVVYRRNHVAAKALTRGSELSPIEWTGKSFNYAAISNSFL